MQLFFALTMLVSATLLFLVQPMFAKMVLPSLGGTPAVWNTCMVFYQAVLLAGYLYAHLATRWLGTRRQATWHLWFSACRGSPCRSAWPSSGAVPSEHSPIPWLLGCLTLSVGLPFFVVSTSAPDAAGLVRRHPTPRRPRSVFPVRRQQPGQPGGALGLSAARRTTARAGRASVVLDVWLRAVDAADGGLRGVPVADGCRAGRALHGRDGNERERRRHRGRGTDLGPAVPVGGAVLCSVEFAFGRDDVHVHRHRRGAAAVGDSAGAVPADVRVGVRPLAHAAARVGSALGGGPADQRRGGGPAAGKPFPDVAEHQAGYGPGSLSPLPVAATVPGRPAGRAVHPRLAASDW